MRPKEIEKLLKKMVGLLKINVVHIDTTYIQPSKEK